MPLSFLDLYPAIGQADYEVAFHDLEKVWSFSSCSAVTFLGGIVAIVFDVVDGCSFCCMIFLWLGDSSWLLLL